MEALYLFGSYAKGTAASKSDLDIRVEKGDVKSLLQLSGLRIALSEALKKPLDLMTTQSLSESFLNQIRNDEVVLYARSLRFQNKDIPVLLEFCNKYLG